MMTLSDLKTKKPSLWTEIVGKWKKKRSPIFVFNMLMHDRDRQFACTKLIRFFLPL